MPPRKWKAENFRRYLPVRVMQRCCIVVMLILLVLGASLVFNDGKAAAQSFCPRGTFPYTVVHGDTLSKIAARYGVSWRSLASDNRLANPNLIYQGQAICIVGAQINGHVVILSATKGLKRSGFPTSPGRSRNVFPYGACTWWADQRYFQLHGVFVPWRTQASAWQWVARAYQFDWRVSSRPSPGAIVVLQPWVQGAYGLGHVAVVERILNNGHVMASNMSWGPYPWQVTYVQFAPGPGVTFVSRL